MTSTARSTAAWREVLALFDRWAAADPARRAAELQRAQAEHPALYPRLLAMIEADRAAEAGNFLGEAAAPLPAEPLQTDWSGTRLGAWELREPIGSGGMGQVWRATRSDGLYSGRAAVKLLHAARMDPQAQARFAHEGEFLARLSHPHIAQLLDAGLTADRTRYLVLEYVPGERIDQWCDARKLGIEARLRLFMQVCEAVAYAHAHLVVHRRECLLQHERRAHQHERPCECGASRDRAHHSPCAHQERDGQKSSQHNHHPPARRQDR